MSRAARGCRSRRTRPRRARRCARRTAAPSGPWWCTVPRSRSAAASARAGSAATACHHWRQSSAWPSGEAAAVFCLLDGPVEPRERRVLRLVDPQVIAVKEQAARAQQARQDAVEQGPVPPRTASAARWSTPRRRPGGPARCRVPSPTPMTAGRSRGNRSPGTAPVRGTAQGQRDRVGVNGDDRGRGDAGERPRGGRARPAAEVERQAGPAIPVPASTASMSAVNLSSRSARYTSCWRSQRAIQSRAAEGSSCVSSGMRCSSSLAMLVLSVITLEG